MIPLGHCLLAAIETGYLSSEQWRDWADRVLLLQEKPEIWVIDLAMAKTIEEARCALQDRLRSEELARGYLVSVGNLKLGFLFRAYERGDFALHELLERSGILAESGFTDTGRREFYGWLNSVEEGAEIEKPDLIFADYLPLAASALDSIEAYAGTEAETEAR